jgi:hypothetical protein
LESTGGPQWRGGLESRSTPQADHEMKHLKTMPALFAVILMAGCAQIQPDNDPVIVNAERTTIIALETFDTFLQWEYENRLTLLAVPEIKRTADRIRVDGQQWLETARTMTKAYKETRADADKNNLLAAVAILRTALVEATRYLGMQVPPLPNQ